MKVSYKWLREYVDIDVPVGDLSARLTLAGLAVEGIEYLGKGIEKVYTGKILEIAPHPNADKLTICSVTTGEDSLHQIVTGATNIKQGDTIPVAVEGAKLPNGVTIKKAKLRGVESRGMLCSGQELGIDAKTMPPDQAHGIMILPPDTPLGLDAKEVLGLNDVIMELELTPNRGDAMSMLGVAREVAALYNLPLKMPGGMAEVTGENAPGIKVEILAPELCGRYVARLITGVRIGTSPLWLQERLRAAGVRPINNVVDITNYVMMEMGQPLHAFDYETLGDAHIIVRSAAAGETITSLDGAQRTLTEDMLVIADPRGAVAVAGVMGGLATEVTAGTTSVLLESAFFNPVSIRRTSRKLGLRSESSARFERGIDITGCANAANRAAYLMESLASGKAAPALVDNYPMQYAAKSIILRPARVEHILGINIPREEIVKGLEGLLFTVQPINGDLLVKVPGHRTDVTMEMDLIEEVARMYGYNRLPLTLPTGDTTRGGRTPEQDTFVKIKDTMAALGFFEVVTYSFTSPGVFDRINLPGDSPLRQAIPLQNPLSEEHSVMRTTLLPGVLEVLQRNVNRRNYDLGIFEIGSQFKAQEPGPLPLEEEILVAAALGKTSGGWNTPARPYDYYYIKGAVETLFNIIGAGNYSFEAQAQNTSYHPGRCATILVEGQRVGVLGELNPDVLENYGLPVRAVALEINLSRMAAMVSRHKKYKPLAKYPEIDRDLALVVKLNVPVKDIVNAIKAAGGPLLRKISLFDEYRGDQVIRDSRSLAFALKFQADDRTLTDAEAAACMEKINERIEKDFGAVLRAQ